MDETKDLVSTKCVPPCLELIIKANSVLEGFFKWEHNNVTRKFDISSDMLNNHLKFNESTETLYFFLKSTPPPRFLVFKMAITSTECST